QGVTIATPVSFLYDNQYSRSCTLKEMKVLALAIACLLAPCQAQSPDPLRATHDALFASFIPMEDASHREMFLSAREAIWVAANQAPPFRALLTPFVDLRSLGAECGVSELLGASRPAPFSGLDASARSRVLALLHTCSSSEPRRLAMGVRNFYLS